MKKTIRLTESDLHRLITESVERIVNEWHNDKNYGEKWYNPTTWKSGSTKRQIDRDRYWEQQRKEWEEREAAYNEKMKAIKARNDKYERERAQRVQNNGGSRREEMLKRAAQQIKDGYNPRISERDVDELLRRGMVTTNDVAYVYGNDMPRFF